MNDPLVMIAMVAAVIVLIIAVTAIIIVRFALDGTASSDRARVLNGVARIIRAIRGRRQ
ncbi:hypothetical protein AB0K12_35345 [Nonomuraea sp. NPDC049419]|uniref:hypothetical protein n=1 Tax=Nonomuraea sp. NPDC049419 TaxID=3155772 RepID=UPI00341B4500